MKSFEISFESILAIRDSSHMANYLRNATKNLYGIEGHQELLLKISEKLDGIIEEILLTQDQEEK